VLERLVIPLRTHDLVAEARAGNASMTGMQLCHEASGEAVAQACTDAGVLARTIRDNTLQICPPFVTTDDEISMIVENIIQALDTYPA
jgi:adenosylmethionine-8-amino-7-oxononanoate aminotransferase